MNVPNISRFAPFGVRQPSCRFAFVGTQLYPGPKRGNAAPHLGDKLKLSPSTGVLRNAAVYRLSMGALLPLCRCSGRSSDRSALPTFFRNQPRRIGFSAVNQASAGGAPQVSPARKGGVSIQANLQRRRCDTPINAPSLISIGLQGNSPLVYPEGIRGATRHSPLLYQGPI